MTHKDVHFSFPAQRAYGILLRMAVSGAAAAYQLPLDMLEDLRSAAEEALDFLLSTEERADARVLCDLMSDEEGSVTLELRLDGRSGVPALSPDAAVTAEILKTIMNDVALFADANGGTRARMTLRRVK